MRQIGPRSAWDVHKSCPYEGPYHARNKIADVIFTVVIFGGLGIMLFYSL